MFVLLVGTAIREGIAAFAGIGAFPSVSIRSPDTQAIDCAGVWLMEGWRYRQVISPNVMVWTTPARHLAQ
jgi:hypothetical protein